MYSLRVAAVTWLLKSRYIRPRWALRLAPARDQVPVSNSTTPDDASRLTHKTLLVSHACESMVVLALGLQYWFRKSTCAGKNLNRHLCAQDQAAVQTCLQCISICVDG